MTIFEYMGILDNKPVYVGGFLHHYEKIPLDGNLMVQAINTMRENQHEDDFEQYVSKAYLRDDNADKENYIVWLFGSPANFFKLMQEALDKGIIAAQP